MDSSYPVNRSVFAKTCNFQKIKSFWGGVRPPEAMLNLAGGLFPIPGYPDFRFFANQDFLTPGLLFCRKLGNQEIRCFITLP